MVVRKEIESGANFRKETPPTSLTRFCLTRFLPLPTAVRSPKAENARFPG
jgi:hypothetical protein